MLKLGQLFFASHFENLGGNMEGVIAAVPTPVNENGEPQQVPFVEHCKWVLTNGGDGLNILGSTGEANSFSTSARKQIMSWAADAISTDQLMVGTGTPSLAETITLTCHAADLGYSVALVLPPYYYKPISNEGLVAWYTALHAALKDRPIQVYFYNFPQMAGLGIPVSVINALASANPARFTGIKDSSGDLEYCRDIVKAVPNMRVFPSSETALGVARGSGFAGCISATVNETVALSAEVWQGQGSGGTADEVARQRTAIAGPTLIPSVKALVEARTFNPIWRNTLPPFVPLTDNEVTSLMQRLSA